MKMIFQMKLWDTDEAHYMELGLFSFTSGLHLPFSVLWDRTPRTRNWLVRVGFLWFELELIRLSK